jgi:uncharacterized protein (TIGR02268 family)
VVSSGLIGGGKGGVASEDLSWPTWRFTLRKGNALKPQQVWSYRSHSRLAVEVWLQLLVGEQLWVAAGAALVDAHGRELPVLPVWQEAPVTLKKSKSVVVEAEAPPGEIQGPYILKLWEAGGPRSVTLEGLVFPQPPGSPAP